MLPEDFRVDPDIRAARTPPAAMYRDPAWLDAVAQRTLARGWHVVGTADEIASPGSVLPHTLLPGVLDEPIVLTRDHDGTLRALSNVCTHRGNVVATQAGPARLLACGYHGRCFTLDGALHSAPGFDDCPGFPGPGDALRALGAAQWGPLVFAAVAPRVAFDALIRPVTERLGWIDFAAMRPDPSAARDYEIDAPWLLYVENFLEGYHVPYVHPELARSLDVGAYETTLLQHGVLQVGTVRVEEEAFDLPAGHADRGRRIGAYWWWLHPTTMLNVYPWGLSLNVIQPLGPSRTRVRYQVFVADASLRGRGAGADLHRVEMQDEDVVLGVARGLRSSLWQPGRYAPSQEQGVHHFHRMLAAELAGH